MSERKLILKENIFIEKVKEDERKRK